MSNPGLKQHAKDWVKGLLDHRLVHYHVERPANGVMLTFDDGPDPELTPRVLDLLDEHDAHGTFFIIGERAEQAPELVGEIHRRGHLLANHSWTHLNEFRGGGYSFGQYLEEIQRCQALVKSLTGGFETYLFRPPRGELNHTTIAATLWSGHDIVHWSLEGGEWADREAASASEIADFLVSTLQPRDIVLLHDDNEKTLGALESMLPIARERQYDLAQHSLLR